MATTRTAPAARPVAKSKGGFIRTRLTHAEAGANLRDGLAVELLVWTEGQEEAGPTSYWLAVEVGAYRLTKVVDEEGSTVYRLPRHNGAPTGCNCDDSKYRGAARPCKHRRMVANTLAALGVE